MAMLALAVLEGGVLGAIFFGGLWWTVRQLVTARRPALLFFASLLLRMGIALAGFYFVGAGHWQRLLLCLLGFLLARLTVTRFAREAGEPREATGGRPCA
ncbi:MAG: ATP synthase subunit I [Nevskiales bacterium]